MKKSSSTSLKKSNPKDDVPEILPMTMPRASTSTTAAAASLKGTEKEEKDRELKQGQYRTKKKNMSDPKNEKEEEKMKKYQSGDNASASATKGGDTKISSPALFFDSTEGELDSNMSGTQGNNPNSFTAGSAEQQEQVRPGAYAIAGPGVDSTAGANASVDSLLARQIEEMESGRATNANKSDLNLAKNNSQGDVDADADAGLVIAAVVAPDDADIDAKIEGRVREEANRLREEMMKDVVKASILKTTLVQEHEQDNDFDKNKNSSNDSNTRKKWYLWVGILLLVISVGIIGAVVGTVLSKRSDKKTEVPSSSPTEMVVLKTTESPSIRLTSSPTLSPTTTPSPTTSPTMPPRDWFKIKSLRDGMDDEYGFSIDMSGSGKHLAIGTILGGVDGKGYVRVYEQTVDNNDNEVWNQVGLDIVSDNDGDFRFGTDVAIGESGRMVVVTSAIGIAYAYEYKEDGSNEWTRMETRNDDGSIVSGTKQYSKGLALSRDGFYLSVISNSQVRVFDRNRGWWELYSSSSYSELFRADSTAISSGKGGTRVAVGYSSFEESWGVVRVLLYSQFDGSWSQVGNTIYGKNPYDYTGEAVELSKDGFIVAVGSGQTDRNGKANTGLVTVYTITDNDGEEWVQMGNEIIGDLPGDAMGMVLSLSDDGKRLLVGSQFSNGRSEKGYIRAFQYNDRDDTWHQLGDDLEGEAPLEEFGFSIAMSSEGNRIAVSAPDQSNDSVAGTGYVDIYELEDLVSKRNRFN